jgi:hypothetical protein
MNLYHNDERKTKKCTKKFGDIKKVRTFAAIINEC